jgi:hypothetical protein
MLIIHLQRLGKMKERIIRTNIRCEKCGGFLIFEVKDSDKDRNGNKILCGTWVCTICEGRESGLWVGYHELTKKDEKFCETCGQSIGNGRILDSL